MISVFLLRANNIQKSLLYLQVCLTMCDNSVLIREKTGQRKPIFWHIIRRKDFIVFIFAYRSNVCIQAITLMYYMHSLFLYLFLSDKKYLQWNSKVISYGFLRISQSSHQNTCVGVSFNKFQAFKNCNFIKDRLRHRYFPVNLTKFLKTPML